MIKRLFPSIIALLVLGTLPGRPARAQQQVTLPLNVQGSDAVPDSATVDLLLYDGEIYLEQGDFLNAVAHFTRAVALAPDRQEAHLLLARGLTGALLGGQIQDVEGAATEALTQYRWVLDHDSQSTEAHNGVSLLSERFLHGVTVPLKSDRGRKAWTAGQRALEKGDVKGAVSALRNAAAAEPGVPEVHRALGRALLREKDYAGARPEFEKALELNAHDAISHVGLGRVLEAAGDTAAALVHYRRAFSLDESDSEAVAGVVRVLDPRDPGTLNLDDRGLYGRALLASGRYDDAARILEDVAAEAPTVAYRKALGIAKFFQGNSTDASIILLGVHQADPQDAETLYYLAASLIRSGRIEDGQNYLRDALALNPEDPSSLRLLGLTLAEEPGQEEGAVAALKRAQELGLDADDIPCVLGSLELHLGRDDDARKDLQDCLSRRPDNPGAVLGLGIVADDQGRKGEAIVHLEHYLDLADPDPSVLFRLAVAYLRTGRDDKAFETLRRVVSMDSTLAPPDSVTDSDTALLEMTSFFLSSLRRFDDAAFVGEMLLSRDPAKAVYNNNLAMTYADADQNAQRAYELARKANQLEPDNPGYMDTLAWTLVRLKRYDDAEKTFLRSIRLAGQAGREDLSEVYYHLGYLYRLMDRHDDASTYLTKALENPPTPYLKAEIERLLDLEKTPAGGDR